MQQFELGLDVLQWAAPAERKVIRNLECKVSLYLTFSVDSFKLTPFSISVAPP